MEKQILEYTVFIKCKLNEDPDRVHAVLVTRDEDESLEVEAHWQSKGFHAWRDIEVVYL